MAANMSKGTKLEIILGKLLWNAGVKYGRRNDSEILCYHLYDRNRFEDYLFFNAYLERSGRSRHKYASVIKENDGTLSFKLNFQVR